jgi:broad specificity phosphatase PhoE
MKYIAIRGILALILDQQAQAVGKVFSGVKIDHIYASPLLRAHDTGQAVRNAQPSPQPPFTVNPNLREQHFGIAEGQPWVMAAADQTEEELLAKNMFPVLLSPSAKFPEGESIDDLARRAEEGIKECVLPHVLEDNVHIAIASHGLCISELIAALLRLDPDSRRNVSYRGLLNTAWTRATISVKVMKKYACLGVDC